MDNIGMVVGQGMCTGCGACNICEHIRFEKNAWGVPVPIADDQCRHCGKCLIQCIYDPDHEEDDE